ncbi:hypothetical protein A4X03_0g2977 [Tilletia caries]|uniref:Uncharacterized protein n=1 Tax=Tilletia caries TaxID=13290 RepID=A0A8T8TLS0_9BASI|nr:hypothetical protein A4X03_0g2977 [Tilletia caries]
MGPALVLLERTRPRNTVPACRGKAELLVYPVGALESRPFGATLTRNTPRHQATAEVRSIAQPTTKRWTVDVLFHSSQLLCSLLPQTPHTYLPQRQFSTLASSSSFPTFSSCSPPSSTPRQFRARPTALHARVCRVLFNLEEV